VTRRRPTIIIAGGGTGGHVFPGLAVADSLRLLADVDVVFAGTPRGLEARLIPERGYRLTLLEVAPMAGGGAGRAVRGAFLAARATLHALSLLRDLAPRVVVSVGGYAAGPVSLAAAVMRIPLAIIEPNSILGLANRILAPWARRAYVAWDETALRLGQSRARVYGVPIRTGFGPRTYEASNTRRVLVLGGSQGAAALNDRTPEALGVVRRALPDLEVLHQAGSDRVAQVRGAYARFGLTRVEVVPFISDVPQAMARADVILARAGASTVAEIAAIGRASLLVPFPHAAGDHQAKNAQALEERGGALYLRQEVADPTRLARELTSLLEDAPRRTRIASAARATGRPDAADRIARDLLELAGIPLVARAKINGHSHVVEVP
jgi:UDP-N-acetylglucosamine--N-acetylmuramyl-(pentapeptide) pyrophosphoryl-undecaprenol N-acetylglucosamine transferase